MMTVDAEGVPLPAIPHLLEVSQVAHRLSLSEDYVRRLIRKREIPAIRFGTRYRVDPLDLQRFIAAQRVAHEGQTRAEA